MTDAMFRGDCAGCIGLCCVALSFDRGPLFVADKAAGDACPNLGADHCCAIHDHLQAEGYAGCIAYDCLGAGQLVTAMFRGLSWRSSPAMARQMFRAFALVRDIQQLRAVLHGQRPNELRNELLDQLEPPAGWTYTALLLDAPVAIAVARAKLKAVAPR